MPGPNRAEGVKGVLGPGQLSEDDRIVGFLAKGSGEGPGLLDRDEGVVAAVSADVGRTLSALIP